MKYGRIPGLDRDISRLVLGCDWLCAGSEDNRLRSFRALDEAVEAGCNALDTAHVYGGGESERAIGLWMQERGNRNEVVVLTKGAHPNAYRRRVTPFDIESDLHDSLARLKTDYIDLLLLHRDDPDVDVGHIVETLNGLHAKGMIRAFGGSNWTHRRIEQANEYAYRRGLIQFAASSPNFGLAEQVRDPWGGGCVSIGGPEQAEARDWYLRHEEVKLFAYSSLARGFFSGRITSDMSEERGRELLDEPGFNAYFHTVNLRRLARVEALATEKHMAVPQIASAYVFSHRLHVFALQAPRTGGELRQNIEAMELELTDGEMAWLEQQG